MTEGDHDRQPNTWGRPAGHGGSHRFEEAAGFRKLKCNIVFISSPTAKSDVLDSHVHDHPSSRTTSRPQRIQQRSDQESGQRYRWREPNHQVGHRHPLGSHRRDRRTQIMTMTLTATCLRNRCLNAMLPLHRPILTGPLRTAVPSALTGSPPRPIKPRKDWRSKRMDAMWVQVGVSSSAYT